MDQAKHKTGFGTWLRRTWTMVMLALEAMDRSPMEEVIDRLDRLEQDRRAPVMLRRSQGRRKGGGRMAGGA
jgi:hypothetical protein